MPTTFESGHAQNVANFEDLISFCTAYGVLYNPSREALKIPALHERLTVSQNALKDVKTTQTAFNNATNARKDSFKPLRSLATKIINALDATDASAETVKDARAINRKLQGKRATPKTSPAQPPAEGAATPDAKTISSSQQSYDLQVDHFDRLIELLVSDGNYMPNEADLKTPAMKGKLSALKAANTAVVDGYTNYSNSLIARNTTLYDPSTGLVNAALDVKKYVKSIYGATAPQYKQISGLAFRIPKD